MQDSRHPDLKSSSLRCELKVGQALAQPNYEIAKLLIQLETPVDEGLASVQSLNWLFGSGRDRMKLLSGPADVMLASTIAVEQVNYQNGDCGAE